MTNRPVTRAALLSIAAALCVSFSARADDVSACNALQSSSITDSSITSVTYVDAGTPNYCQIELMQTPDPDSIILSVVRLPPTAMWNGEYLGYGNGGFAGGSYGAPAIRAVSGKYYAVATTNMGTGNTGSDVIDNFDRISDWGYRSTHEMTVAAKELVQIYYGSAATKSFFSGISTGGQQGLVEAQRYPDDYDAIVSGAPVTNRTRLHANFNWSYAAFFADPQSTITSAQLTALHTAVINACDAIDGVTDGVIRDARACTFQPSALLCGGSAPASTCLTSKQVAAVERVYGGMLDPVTGELLAHGWPRGSELDWQTMYLGAGPSYPNIHQWVFGSGWLWRNYDYHSDVAYEDETLGGLVNAIDPDLTAFKSHGGKLLNYHGWADPTVNPYDTIHYYENVDATVSGGAHSFHRLFMVPGKNHGQSGPGPAEPDFLGAMESWVTSGVAPDMLIASSSGVSRPLCAYPNFAQYNGTGNVNSAGSFTCVLSDSNGLVAAGQRAAGFASSDPAQGGGCGSTGRSDGLFALFALAAFALRRRGTVLDPH